MSRTGGIHLPRLPTSHVRATSSNAVQHHPKRHDKRLSLSEPHYTAYVGTPRQDVPTQVYRDAAMFDDVFDKQGRLLTGRNTPKFTNPLNSMEYNSLHDPHCRRLFLNNQALRDHLTNLGLLTDDLRVIANTKEQRQKIRGHELLERKEELMKNISERENRRLERLQRQASLPLRYQKAVTNEEERKKRWEQIQKQKINKEIESQKVSKTKEIERKQEKKKQLKQVLEQIKLLEQTKRNTYMYEQQQAELETYKKKHGSKAAFWFRESDRIHNRIVYLERTQWSKQRKTAAQEHKTARIHPDLITSSLTNSPIVMDNISSIHKTTVVGDDKVEAEKPKVEAISPSVVEERPKSPMKTQIITATPIPDKVTEQIPEQERKGTEERKKENDEDQERVKAAAESVSVQQKGSPTSNSEEKKKIKQQHDLSTVAKTKKDDPTSDIDKEQQETTEEESEEVPVTDKESFVSEKPLLLGQEESIVEMTNLFFDIFQQLDSYRTGHIRIETFSQIMSSSDLALPLDQEEIMYIGDQISRNGWITLEEGTSYLPSLLVGLFQQRMSEQIQYYGAYIEDRWLQLSSPHMGYIYLDKTTGLVQRGGRPLDYRPFLKDNWFEDIIVEFFENADRNRDGYVDQEEILAFLQSPVVHSRVYSHQLDELLKLFVDQTVEGVMTLEQFVPFAHVILQMIYANSYPDNEWVELESRKCGKYLFNPSTGETKRASKGSQTSLLKPKESTQDPSTIPRAKSRRRKRKESREKEERKESSSKPPPLRRKSGQSIKSDKYEVIESSNQSEDTITMESVSIDSNAINGEGSLHSNDDGTTRTMEQVAERLQKGLHVIDTIPEEDELRPESAMDVKEPLIVQSTTPSGAAVNKTENIEGTTSLNSDDNVKDTIDAVLQKVIDDREKQQS